MNRFRVRAALAIACTVSFGLTGLATAGPANAEGETCFGVPATIIGTDGNDTLNGTSGADVIWAGAGDDTVDGLNGADRICGGEGNDILTGGLNGDQIMPGPGNDQVMADTPEGDLHYDTVSFAEATGGVVVNLVTGQASGEGTDTLQHVDHVVGSPFNDTLTGDDDGDPTYLSGGAGDDGITASDGDHTILGGDGNDTITVTSEPESSLHLQGDGGDDTITSSAGSDFIYGGAGNDVIFGGAGNDQLMGEDGNDELHGEVGADHLGGAGGDDLMHGGDHTDSVTYADAPNGINASFADGVVTGWGSDTIEGFEQISGSKFADVLIGDGNHNIFVAGNGNDLIAPGGGDDDVLGGGGNDTLDYSLSTHKVRVLLASGDAFGQGWDNLDQVESAIGSPFADKMTGSSAKNTFSGGGGADVLRGAGGADLLKGGAGNDALAGDAGTDRCEGGSGKDTATSCESKSSIP